MTVLLLGGVSCSGKTTAARALAKRLRAEVVAVDDLRDADLHSEFDFLASSPQVWDLDPASLCAHLVSTAERMVEPICQVIQDHGGGGEKLLIIEGEAIHPMLAGESADLTRRGCELRSVFVIEHDAERLAETLRRRSSSFRRLTPARQRTVVEMDLLYARWIKDLAEQQNHRWLPSAPFDSLPDRIMCASSGSLRAPRPAAPPCPM